MSKEYEVTIVNPTSNPRRRRRRSPARKPAARRRRRTTRATSNPAPPARRRSYARRNPSFAGFGFTRSMFSDTALRLVGKLAGAFFVKLAGHDGADPQSETTGARWSFVNHALNIGGGILAGWAVGGLLGSHARQMVLEGAIDQSVQKAFWSELVHRTEAGPKWLGQANEGDVLEDGRGRSWVRQGGRWVSLLGGRMGALSEKTALDGLEYANSLGRYRERRRRPFGHLQPANAMDDPHARVGPLLNSGSVNPYQAAYM